MAERMRRFFVPTEGGTIAVFAEGAADAERRVRLGEGALADLEESASPARVRTDLPAEVPSPRPAPIGPSGRPGMGVEPGPIDPVLQFQQSAPESDLFNIGTRGVATGAGGFAGGVGGAFAAGPVGAIGMAGLGSAGAGAAYDVLAGEPPSAEQALEDFVLGAGAETVGLGTGLVIGGALAVPRTAAQAAARTQRIRSGLARVAGKEDPVVADARRRLDTTVREAQAATEAARSQKAAGQFEVATARGRLTETEAQAAPLERVAVKTEQEAAETQARLLTAQKAVLDEAAAEVSAQDALLLARTSAERLVRSVAGAEPVARGAVAKAGLGFKVADAVDLSIQGFKTANNAAFRQIDEAIGEAPVIMPMRLREEATRLVSVGKETLGASPPARRLAGVQEPAEAATRRIGLSETDIRGLGTSAQEQILQALMEGLEVPLTWRQARHLEAQLGEIAFRGGQPFGTVRQGEARTLYRAIRKDLDEFLKTAGGVNPALDAAKQTYRITRTLSNSTLARTLRTNPDAVFDTVFRVSASGEVPVSKVLDFKGLVPDPVYQQVTAGYVARMVDRSTVPTVGGGRLFSPSQFVKQAEPLLKAEGGRAAAIDVILEPEAARAFRETVAGLRPLVEAEKRLTSGASATAVAEAQATAREAGVTFVRAQGAAQQARGAAEQAAGRARAATAEARATEQQAGVATFRAEQAAERVERGVDPAREALKTVSQPVWGLRPYEMASLFRRSIVGIAGLVGARQVIGREGTAAAVDALTAQWQAKFGLHVSRAAAQIIGQAGIPVLSAKAEWNVTPAMSLRRGVTEFDDSGGPRGAP